MRLTTKSSSEESYIRQKKHRDLAAEIDALITAVRHAQGQTQDQDDKMDLDETAPSEVPQDVMTETTKDLVAEAPRDVVDLHESLHKKLCDAKGAVDFMTLIEVASDVVGQMPNSTALQHFYCDLLWMLYKAGHDVTATVYEDCSLADGKYFNLPWQPDDQALINSIVTWDLVIDTFERAVSQTRYNINDSNTIWDAWVELKIWNEGKQDESPDDIRNAYLSRLSEPHATIDDTISNFLRWVEKHPELSQENEARAAHTQAQGSKTWYQNRQPHEDAVVYAAASGVSATEREDAERRAWLSYLAWEAYHSKPKKGVLPSNMHHFIALCWRALGRFPRDSDFWLVFALFMAQGLPQGQDEALQIIHRALNNCPERSELWRLYIHAAEVCDTDIGRFQIIMAEALDKMEPTLKRDKDILSRLEVEFAFANVLRRHAFATQATDEERDEAYQGIKRLIKESKSTGQRRHPGYLGDPSLRLERVLLRFFAQAGWLKEGRSYIKQLRFQNGTTARFFADTIYHWEMSVHNMGEKQEPPSAATQVLLESSHSGDSADVEAYMLHCQLHETPGKILEAFEQTQRLLRKAKIEGASTTAPSAQLPDRSNKRTRNTVLGEDARLDALEAGATEESAEPKREQPATTKRDREHTTVLVRDLPSDTDEATIRRNFKACGTIKNIEFHEDKFYEDGVMAVVEFTQPTFALAALSRDKKMVGEHQIDVTLATGCTLFVTNYEPTVDEKWIRNIFGRYGTVISVRFPSLTQIAIRRFCYVQYASAEQAKAAVRNLDSVMFGRAQLVVKLSDPTVKNAQRSGAVAEKREICVMNVHWEASEDDVRKFFTQYGEVLQVRLPRKWDGRSKGLAFVEFADATAAEASLEANKMSFMHRLLNVALTDLNRASKHRATTWVNPAPSSNGDEDVSMAGSPEASIAGSTSGARRASEPPHLRTLAIMNVAQTVTVERVNEIASKYGAIVSSKLHGGRGGATVEFATIADATAARAGIPGTELDGQELTTGEPHDLFPPSRGIVRSHQPHTTISRGRAGLGARRGRGLVGRGGFVRSRGESSSAAGGASGGSAAGRGGLSQDDFRKMLGGGSGGSS